MKIRESRRGGVLFALLLSAGVILVLAVAAGAYVARHITIETHGRRDAADVSIDIPGGQLSIHARKRPGESVGGIPNYPGARPFRNSGGNALIQWNSERGGEDKDFAVSGSVSITDDPPDQVVEHYRKRLPNWIVAREQDGLVQLTLSQGGYKRIVAIEEKPDGTHIGVAAAGEPASN